MKPYTMRPLSEQERASYDGFTHIAEVAATDLTTLATGTAQNITLGPIPLGSSLLAEAHIRAGFYNSKDTASNSITCVLQDDAAAVILASFQVDAEANLVFDDAVLNSTTTVTSATAAFVAGDVGKRISGIGIPAGTTIASRTNGTTIILSAAATATASGVSITLPDRTATPVATPVVRGALCPVPPLVYTVDSHLVAVFTPITGKALNDVNIGDLFVLVKLINPISLTKLKGTTLGK